MAKQKGKLKKSKKKVKRDFSQLPDTQEVTLNNGKRFVVGWPLMRHGKEVAIIIRGLKGIYSEMIESGQDELIAEIAQKMEISVEELAQMPLEDLPKELRAKLLEEDQNDMTMDKLAEFQTEIIHCCLKEAPFDWDPQSSDISELNREDFTFKDGTELMGHCVPYVLGSIPGKDEKKK